MARCRPGVSTPANRRPAVRRRRTTCVLGIPDVLDAVRARTTRSRSRRPGSRWRSPCRSRAPAAQSAGSVVERGVHGVDDAGRVARARGERRTDPAAGPSRVGRDRRVVERAGVLDDAERDRDQQRQDDRELERRTAPRSPRRARARRTSAREQASGFPRRACRPGRDDGRAVVSIPGIVASKRRFAHPHN